jgi:glycosyltransferase involved in cell wall biosynthesis
MVNHYAGLPDQPSGARHYWLAQGLSALGWDVRLIRSGSVGGHLRRLHVEVLDGIEVTTIRGKGKQARGWRRLLDWADFSLSLLDPSVTRHLPDPDIVLGSTVHLGAAWASRSLARRHRARFIFEVRDLWPETLIALGALRRNSLSARAMTRLEGSLAHSADLIVSPLAGVGRYMEARHHVPEEKFRWISNGVHADNYSRLSPPVDGPLRLQYFGSLGTANDVELIIEAVAKANEGLDEPVRLQIRGEGPCRQQLLSRVVNEPGMNEKVTFEPAIPSSQVPSAMAWGNALVVTVRDLPELYQYGIAMNKLFDYLASGRWIVMASDVSENPIAMAPGLTLCKPSVDELAGAIVKLAGISAEERNSLAAGNSLIARERFDYHVLAADLARSLEDL